MLPVQANTTCDIYRAGGATPDPADVPGMPCFVTPCFTRGREVGEGLDESLRYTHVMLIDKSADIRDGWVDFATAPTTNDRVYIPADGLGTGSAGQPMKVVFVERVGRGTPSDCKRVYLRREAWFDGA